MAQTRTARIRLALAAPGSVRGAVKTLALVVAAAVLAGTAACGETTRARVPDVSGERLDLAEADLDAVDLHYSVVGGGAFGVIVRSHWQVCDQEPEPGEWATSVELYVERSCDDWGW